MSPEDRELDRAWRERFGQPLPILGCGDVVRRLLEEAAAGAAREVEPLALAA